MENTMVKSPVMTEVMDEQEKITMDRIFRERFIERLDVLDRVKTLLLMPYLDMMTITELADWYKTDVSTIRKCYDANKDEIDSDGVRFITLSWLKDFLQDISKRNDFRFKMSSVNENFITDCDNSQNIVFQTQLGKVTVIFPNGTEITIPNRGIRCFSKRAVLRIGMLLRDSEVAKAVRTQLLNIEEKAEQYAPAIVTEAVDEESNIMLEIGKAFASGDLMTFGNACTKMIAFKNRHIAALTEKNSELMETNSKLTERNKSLENVNHLLVDKTVRWTNRNTIVRLINCLVGETKMKHKVAWNMLYKHLRYRYGISLRQRAANAEKNGARSLGLLTS